MIAFNAINIKNNCYITLISFYSEKFLLIFYSESLKAPLYLEIYPEVNKSSHGLTCKKQVLVLSILS